MGKTSPRQSSLVMPVSVVLQTLVTSLVLGAPQLDQLARTDDVTAAQKRRDVDVERRVRLRAAEQHADGADALEHAVRGRPGVLEQVEADLAVLQRNVGVHDLRDEAHPGRLEGVLVGDVDGEKPAAACVTS